MIPLPNLGAKINFHVKIGDHPAVSQDYQTEGVVVAVLQRGDCFFSEEVDRFQGDKRLIGRVASVEYVVLKTPRDTYVWLPRPMFPFMREV